MLSCVWSAAAWAYEPPAARWTRITEDTTPALVVNYATITVDEAGGLLERSEAALLYDRDTGFDGMPAEGIRLRSGAGSWTVRTRDAFSILRDEGGYAIFSPGARRKDGMIRVNAPEAPVTRVLGIPARPRWGLGRQEDLFDPVVAVMGSSLFVTQYVSIRTQDPLDPTRDSVPVRVVAASVVPTQALLDQPLSAYTIVVTLVSRGQGSRVMFLPTNTEGALDTGRDGFVLRLTANTSDGSWGQNARANIVPSAVRLHLGDRASLKARIAASPPPPRALYAQPGGAQDPLMLGPRSALDPLGAGAEVRTGVHGELDLVSSGGASNAVQPRFTGVDAGGWVGRAGFGVAARPDLFAVRGGVRLGSMRDTNYTFIGLEAGSVLGAGFTTGPLGRTALNVVIESRRQSDRTLLGLPMEMGNGLRAGTSSVEYELTGGLRGYAGRGLVITPRAFGGFRYQLARQRGFFVVGVGIEVSRNQNLFRRSSPRGSTPQSP
ncbi:MAG: hypothetical protein AB8H79_15440 [Myxococcota bacterium]